MPPLRLSAHPGLSSAGNIVGGNRSASSMNPWAFMGMGSQPMQTMQYPVQPDEGTANSYLAPFGFHTQRPTQNAFLPEPGSNNFFGRHPRLTGMLESGILGAAFTEPSQTAGEGISNVARSLMGVPMYRQQLAAQQISAPFHGADMMASLMQRKAMADYYSGRGDYYDQLPDILKQKEQGLENWHNQQTSVGHERNRMGLAGRMFAANNRKSSLSILGILNDEADQKGLEGLARDQYLLSGAVDHAGKVAAASTGSRKNVGSQYGDVTQAERDQLTDLRDKEKVAQKSLDDWHKQLGTNLGGLALQGFTTAQARADERQKRLSALQNASRDRQNFETRLQQRQKKAVLPEMQGSGWDAVQGCYKGPDGKCL